MTDTDGKGGPHPEPCGECNGCVSCAEIYCRYHSHGNPADCYVHICTYCERYVRKQRLFLNNVG